MDTLKPFGQPTRWYHPHHALLDSVTKMRLNKIKSWRLGVLVDVEIIKRIKTWRGPFSFQLSFYITRQKHTNFKPAQTCSRQSIIDAAVCRKSNPFDKSPFFRGIIYLRPVSIIFADFNCNQVSSLLSRRRCSPSPSGLFPLCWLKPAFPMLSLPAKILALIFQPSLLFARTPHAEPFRVHLTNSHVQACENWRIGGTNTAAHSASTILAFPFQPSPKRACLFFYPQSTQLLLFLLPLDFNAAQSSHKSQGVRIL